MITLVSTIVVYATDGTTPAVVSLLAGGGAALNVNVHTHVLVLDGVFAGTSGASTG